MAELATIARPYAEALFETCRGDLPATQGWLDALAADSLHEVEAVLDGDAESLIVHRDAAGAVRAWLNVCPHAGRRLDWAPGQFLRSKEGLLVCAVHGASFELQRGECVAGPCRGEALREVAVHCVDGGLRLGAGPSTSG